jgi:hypothetical protein
MLKGFINGSKGGREVITGAKSLFADIQGEI